MIEPQIRTDPRGGYLVPSVSAPGAWHRVRLSPARCDCKGFQYRRRCRHLLAVIAMYDARED
jgi:SWIM zinc finger